MKRIKGLMTFLINTLSVLIIIAAAGLSVLIFSSGNRYSQPVFGNTMLLVIDENNALDKVEPDSLALIDLTGQTNTGYYALFTGKSVVLSKDDVASIGTVKGYVPTLGGVIGFFRKPAAFLACIIFPLIGAVVYHTVRISLFAKNIIGRKKRKSGKNNPKG